MNGEVEYLLHGRSSIGNAHLVELTAAIVLPPQRGRVDPVEDQREAVAYVDCFEESRERGMGKISVHLFRPPEYVHRS